MAPESDNILDVTADDIAAGKLIKPGWYKFRVEKRVAKAAKSGKNINNYYTVRGLTGAASGIPVLMNLNSALKNRIVSFIAACSKAEVKPGKIDLEAPVKAKAVFLGKLRHREYEGDMQNDIYKFLPENAEVPENEPDNDEE